MNTCRGFLKLKTVVTNVRFKNPPHHWSVIRKQDQVTKKALEHFDDLYQQIYDKKWESIRKGLLGEKKYVAVINNFGDYENVIQNLEKKGALNVRKLFLVEKEAYAGNEKRFIENILKKSSEEARVDSTDHKIGLKETSGSTAHPVKDETLENNLNSNRLVDLQDALSVQILQEFIPATKIKGKEDFITESSHYKLYDTNTNLGVNIQKEYDLHFPEHLKIFCFEKDNFSKFDPPKKSLTGVYNYYLMDGGSVLPVLALDARPGNKILDMCASPGGKSLLLIQTLYPLTVVSNDVSKSRLNKVAGAYSQFLFDFEEKWEERGKITLTNFDGRYIPEGDYDRILVDAPCSTDRHSVTENDNNIFKSSRIKERLQLPVLQKELLLQALKLVKPGGIVVYSTCSLNPIENDGVVHMALKEMWEETNMKFVIKDLGPALKQTKHVYNLYKGPLRYGHLVLPFVSQNYGPTYFCKIQKIV